MNEVISQLNKYQSLGFIHLKCKGYHTLYNPLKDYNTAKVAIASDFTNSSYIEPSIDDSISWINQGGWIGHLLPVGSISIDVENPLYIKQIEALIEEKGIDTWILKTPNGKQFLFQTSADYSANINQIIKLGVNVSYRVGGKSYIFLPPTLDRCWERFNPTALSPLPEELTPLDLYNPEELLDTIADQLGFFYRNDSVLLEQNATSRISGKDIDHCFMAWLVINIALAKPQIIKIFQRIFRHMYDASRTYEVYERAQQFNNPRKIGTLIDLKLKPRKLLYLIDLINRVNKLKRGKSHNELLIKDVQIDSWLINQAIGAGIIHLIYGFKEEDKIPFGLSLSAYLFQYSKIGKIFLVDADASTSFRPYNKFFEKLEKNKDLDCIPYSNISNNFFSKLEVLLENLPPNSIFIFNSLSKVMSNKYGYDNEGFNTFRNIISSGSTVILLESNTNKKTELIKINNIKNDAHFIYKVESQKNFSFTLINECNVAGAYKYLNCDMDTENYKLMITEEAMAPSDNDVIKTISARLLVGNTIQSVLLDLIKKKHHLGSDSSQAILAKYKDILWTINKGANNSKHYAWIGHDNHKILVDFSLDTYLKPFTNSLTQEIIGFAPKQPTILKVESLIDIGFASKRNIPITEYLKKPSEFLLTTGFACLPEVSENSKKNDISQSLLSLGFASDLGLPLPYTYEYVVDVKGEEKEEKEKREENYSIINLNKIINLNSHSSSFFKELKTYKKNIDDIPRWSLKPIDIKNLKLMYIEEIAFTLPEDIVIGILFDDYYSRIFGNVDEIKEMIVFLIEENQLDAFVGYDINQDISTLIKSIAPTIQIIDIHKIAHILEQDSKKNELEIQSIYLLNNKPDLGDWQEKSYTLRKLQFLTINYLMLYDYLFPLGLTLEELADTNNKKWDNIFKNYYGNIHLPYPDPKPKITRKAKTKDEKLKLVEAVKGTHESATQLDFNSYYPSIQVSFLFCSRKDSDMIGLQILKHLMNVRLNLESQENRDDYNKLKLNTLKLFMNNLSSYYLSHAAFNDINSGKSTLMLGVKILEAVVAKIRAIGGIVIKTNTDSVTYLHESPQQVFETIQNEVAELGLSVKLDFLNATINIVSAGEYDVYDESRIIAIKGKQKNDSGYRQELQSKLKAVDTSKVDGVVLEVIPTEVNEADNKKVELVSEPFKEPPPPPVDPQIIAKKLLEAKAKKLNIALFDEDDYGVITTKSQVEVEKEINYKINYLEKLIKNKNCYGHHDMDNFNNRFCYDCRLLDFCKEKTLKLLVSGNGVKYRK